MTSLDIDTRKRHLTAWVTWFSRAEAILPGGVLPDGKALVASAGFRQARLRSIRPPAELYDPASGAWSLTSSMTTARTSHALTVLQTARALVSGGRDFSNEL